MNTLLRVAFLFGVSLPLASAGCSWSVPADPGLNARLRGDASRSEVAGISSPSSADAARALPSVQGGAAGDGEARAIYLARCGQCHAPFSPRHASAEEWPTFVRKYGPRAGLFGADRDRVLAWLQANAGR